MADAPSIGVGGVGLGVVRFSIWQTLLRKGMWILFGFDSDHRTGNLHLHAVFDSRRGRGHVAHAGLVFFLFFIFSRIMTKKKKNFTYCSLFTPFFFSVLLAAPWHILSAIRSPAQP